MISRVYILHCECKKHWHILNATCISEAFRAAEKVEGWEGDASNTVHTCPACVKKAEDKINGKR